MVLARREKFILYITVGVIGFAVVFNFLLSPVLKKNDSLNKEIAVSRAKLKKYLWLISRKDYFQSRHGQFVATPKAAEGRDAVVKALSELERMAKDAGIRILDLRPQNPKRSGPYKEILVDLRTEGQIEGYLKFVYNIEKSLSLFKIKKFQLNAKSGSSSLEGIFSLSQLYIGD